MITAIPLDPSDIWRAANLLVKKHGFDAAVVAAQRADDLLASGDIVGEMIWKKVVEAIHELQRPEPKEDEHMN